MTPKASLKVGGTKRMVETEAVIDTGFDGDVCVPIEMAVTLGLELAGTVLVELADGSRRVEMIYNGSVRFLGRNRKVQISLTEAEEALIGTALLADCRLTIDFTKDRVRLSRKSAGKG